MSASKQDEFTDTVQIVLIGASGSGKSCSGNTILGKQLLISEASAKSVTCKSQLTTEIINGWQIKVLDTPGWDCTELNKHQVMSQIKQAIQNLKEPYSFLLVIRIGSMETLKEMNQIHDLKKVLGPSFLDHTTILFTRSDDLEEKPFKDFIEEGSEEFRNLLKQCGDRYHCWNNRDNRSVDAVDKLLKDLKKTEQRNTRLQTERKEENPCGSSSHGDQQENVVSASKRSRNAIDTETSTYENHTRVLFLGRKRVGKTSSIRTILRKFGQSEIKDSPIHTCSTSDLSLKLVESPGLEDNLEQIQKSISKSLSDCSPGPHVIILVLNIERFTPTAKAVMKNVKHCLGENVRKHTMILFTGADNLEGKHIESFIQENQHLSKLVKIHQGRYHVLNNRDTSNVTQVDELLKRIHFMYNQNNKEFYTKGQEPPEPEHQQAKPSSSSTWNFFDGLQKSFRTHLGMSNSTK